MKRMILMIGIQGSGKSTFSKCRLHEYDYISLDVLHTRKKERLMVDDCIRRGADFVIDNTNPTSQDRARYISLAKQAGYQIIGFFMQSKLNDCIERNNRREGKAKISSVAIAGTSNKLELPSYSEGFDELYFVMIDNDNFSVQEWRD